MRYRVCRKRNPDGLLNMREVLGLAEKLGGVFIEVDRGGNFITAKDKLTPEQTDYLDLRGLKVLPLREVE